MMYTGTMKMIRLWGPVLVWMALIFIFSSRESVQVSDQGIINFLFFKTLHVIEYTLLYILHYRAVRFSYAVGGKRIWHVTALFLTLAYAVSDEIHQIYVPTREGRPRDVIIDSFGGVFGWYLIEKLLPKVPKKLHNVANRWLAV